MKYVKGISEKLDNVVKGINPEYSAGIEHYERDNKYQVCIYDEDGNMCACSGSMFKHELSAFICELPETLETLKEEYNKLSILL